MAPPPDGDHEVIIGLISRTVLRNLSSDLIAMGNRGLITPRGRFIPDLTIVPPSTFRGTGSWASCDSIELVVEVTSHNAVQDKEAERLGYAMAGVPLFLLVDRDAASAVLFSHPDDEDYRTTDTAPFGKELTLPAPFDITIDTAEFC